MHFSAFKGDILLLVLYIALMCYGQAADCIVVSGYRWCVWGSVYLDDHGERHFHFDAGA